MRYKKLPFHWLFKGCSPLQLFCNLTGNRPQSATFHTANRLQQGYKTASIDTFTLI